MGDKYPVLTPKGILENILKQANIELEKLLQK